MSLERQHWSRLLLAATVVFLLLPVHLGLAQEAGFAGIGIQAVPTSGGELVVLHVIDHAPADKAGLLPGDFIFQIDGHRLAGSDFNQVVRDYLWGDAGSGLTVHYRRPGVAGDNKAMLTREAIGADAEKTPGVRWVRPGN